MLGLCRKVVAVFSGSWKIKRELTRAQINLNLKQHSLISVSHLEHTHYTIIILINCFYIYRTVQLGGELLEPWCSACLNKRKLFGLH